MQYKSMDENDFATIELLKEEVHVYSDSVPCLDKIHEHLS